VAAYEQRVAAVVFDEEYEQQSSCLQAPRYAGLQSPAIPPQARRLRSEVVVINTGDLGWVGFRDVVAVDGRAVHSREERLAKLFVEPGADALLRAKAIADESARFNLGGVHRNLNYPTMALIFLREVYQQRSVFERGDPEQVGGTTTWVVRFREVYRPSLIGSRSRDVLTSGQFWIEPETGKVRRSRLRVQEERASGTVDVEYAAWPGLDVLMPVTMREEISVRGCALAGVASGTEAITGTARYLNVKQYTVHINAEPQRPPGEPR
jgi:hypothetical protein